jgi:nicotinamide riboside transporter PnuC
MDYLALATSVFGLWLNARKNKGCWPVWLASNLLWIGHFLVNAQDHVEWSALALQAIFLLFNVYGWWAWSKGPGSNSSASAKSNI